MARMDTFCTMPWNHQFIGPDGNIKPCCRFVMPKGVRNNIKGDKSLQEVFLGDHQSKLRNDLANGIRNPGCVKCWQEEDGGKKLSLRQNYNRTIGDIGYLHEDLEKHNPKITWLELSFSNRCNLSCRMCGPYYSTNWFKDWKHVKRYVIGSKYPSHSITDEQIDEVVKTSNKDNVIDISKLDFALPHLRHLKMTGGEPFLVPEYREILEKLVDMGRAKDVYLNYSTNCTVMPSNKLINLWSKFKKVEFATSIDGVGPVIEYQRHPTKWEQVEKVVKTLMMLSNEMNVIVGTRPTITLMNVLDVPNITQWWAEMMNKYYVDKFDNTAWINHTHCLHPQYIGCTALPKWAKDIVAKRLVNAPTMRQQQNWDYLVKYTFSEDLWNEQKVAFRDYTNKLDNRRGEDFRKVVPEFARLLDE
jgi:radical SAM protein with 4Fe4S-binding SPASM domain